MKNRLSRVQQTLIAILGILGFAFSLYAQTPPQRDPRIILAQVDQLYYDEKYAEAAEGYEAFLKDHPDSEGQARAMLQLAQTYAKLTRDAEAQNTYRQLIDSDPDGNYAISAVQLMVNLYVQRYQHIQAIQLCKQIIAKYPGTRAASIAGYLIPTYLYSQGKTAESIQAYHRFIEEYPNSIYRASAFSSLIAIYMHQKDFDQAEKLILSYLDDQGGNADLLEQLARVYQRQGKSAEALKLYQQALAQNPDNISILEKIGEIYVEQGDQQRAIAEWQRMVQRNPNQYYQHQRLADIYKGHGFYDQSIAEYETAIRLQPRTAYLYTQLADVYRIRNDMPKAISTYVRALIALGPSYGGRSRIYESLAELYPPERREQAFLAAEAQVQTLLSSSPAASAQQTPSSRINLLLALAELAFHRGDYEQSLAYFRQLARVYNDQGQALQQAAALLERNDEMLAAARFYEEIPQLFPNTGIAFQAPLKAGQAYAKEKRWNQALAALQGASSNSTEALLLRADIQLHYVYDVRGALSTYQQAERTVRSGTNLNKIRLGKIEAMILLGQDVREQIIPLLSLPSPYSQQAQLLLGHTYFFAAEFEQAVEAYKKVSEHNTRNEWSNDALEYLALIRGNSDYFYQPLTLYAQGLRYQLLGEDESALASYSKILEKFPKSRLRGQTHMKLAQIHVTRGNIVAAAEFYEQILSEADVLAAEALFKLAALYGVTDPERAKRAYTQLLEQYPQSIYAPEARQRLRMLLNSVRRDDS